MLHIYSLQRVFLGHILLQSTCWKVWSSGCCSVRRQYVDNADCVLPSGLSPSLIATNILFPTPCGARSGRCFVAALLEVVTKKKAQKSTDYTTARVGMKHFSFPRKMCGCFAGTSSTRGRVSSKGAWRSRSKPPRPSSGVEVELIASPHCASRSLSEVTKIKTLCSSYRPIFTKIPKYCVKTSNGTEIITVSQYCFDD